MKHAFLFIICGWLTCLSGGVASGTQPEEKEGYRPYNEGPLTMGDFQGATPENLPDYQQGSLNAYISTDLQYNFRYQTWVQSRQVAVQLTGIEVYAAVARQSSWNNSRQDQELLDHEQGHFDITQMAALRGQVMFAKMAQMGQSVTGRGRSEQAAVRQLRQRIHRILEPIVAELPRLHKQYDETTNHGNRKATQSEQRHEQTQSLSRLASELTTIGGYPSNGGP